MPWILEGRLFSFCKVRDSIPASVFSSSWLTLEDLDLKFWSFCGVSPNFNATESLAKFMVLSVGLYKSLKLSTETFSFIFEKVGDSAYYIKESALCLKLLPIGEVAY